jgi:hypothetical protein
MFDEEQGGNSEGRERVYICRDLLNVISRCGKWEKVGHTPILYCTGSIARLGRKEKRGWGTMMVKEKEAGNTEGSVWGRDVLEHGNL